MFKATLQKQKKKKNRKNIQLCCQKSGTSKKKKKKNERPFSHCHAIDLVFQFNSRFTRICEHMKKRVTSKWLYFYWKLHHILLYLYDNFTQTVYFT